MYRLLLAIAPVTTLVTALTAEAAPVGHWHFNTYDGDALTIPASTGIGQLTCAPGWSAETVSSPAGTTVARSAATVAGSSLAFVGHSGNGQWFQISVPEATAQSVRGIVFAVRRSGTGFTSLNVGLSRDGGKTFVPVDRRVVTESWRREAFAWPAAKQSGPLTIRLQLDGATGSRGTLRVDNLSVLDSPPGPAEDPVPTHP